MAKYLYLFVFFPWLLHQIHVSSSFVSLGWKFIGGSSWHWWADEHHRLAGEQRGKLLQHPRHSDIPSGTLVQEVDHSSSKPSGLRLCRRNPSGLLGYRTMFNFCVFCVFDLNKGRIECNSLDSDNGLSRGKTDCTIDKPIFRSKIKVGRSFVYCTDEQFLTAADNVLPTRPPLSNSIPGFLYCLLWDWNLQSARQDDLCHGKRYKVFIWSGTALRVHAASSPNCFLNFHFLF